MKPPVASRYQPLQLLKEGMGIATWLGTDLLEDTPVVIKTAPLSTLGNGAPQRLARAADALQAVDCECLARVLHSGSDLDRYAVVLHFVPGVSLREVIEARRLTVSEAMAVARCLFRALASLHEVGVVHRDVKPENIIVDSPQAIGRAVLIDLGLSRTDYLKGSDDAVAGTAVYIAPEQAGLLDHETRPSADIYSAGIVVYEALSGSPPFRASDLPTLLQAHLHAPVLPLRASGLDVPRALDEAVLRMLRKDPRERYQSARAVLADLEAVEAGLAGGDPDPRVVIGLHDPRTSLAEPAFVGRRRQTTELLPLLQTSAPLTLVSLEGPSGSGKSRFLEEVALQAAQRGFLVLHGRSSEGSAFSPSSAIDEVAAEIAAAARQDFALHAHVASLLGEGPQASREVQQETDAAHLKVLASTSLLQSVARHRPTLVLLDDCQWADSLTSAVLQALAGTDAPGQRLMVVAAYRSEDVEPGHRLLTVPFETRLVLDALSMEETAELVASMAGRLPPQVMQGLWSVSSGNPFMAVEAVRGMVESGAGELVLDASVQGLDPPQATSTRAAVLLTRRLGLLPPGIPPVLETAAVLGRSFELDLLSHVIGASASEALSSLEPARDRFLVWSDASDARWAFMHDRIREALLQGVDGERRAAIHARAAAWYQARSPLPVYDLSYHLSRAGEHAAAVPFAMLAAADAKARGALSAAEEHYRIGLVGVDQGDLERRQSLEHGLGDALLQQGRYDEARTHLQLSAGFAVDADRRAATFERLGDLEFKVGDESLALDYLGRGLALLGLPVPRTAAGLAIRIAPRLVRVLTRSHPRTLEPREGPSRDRDLLACRLLGRMLQAALNRGMVAQALWAHLTHLGLAERWGPSFELGEAWTWHGIMCGQVPKLERARRYARRAVEIHQSRGARIAHAMASARLAYVEYIGASFDASRAGFEQALPVLRALGDRWELQSAQHFIASCLLHAGQPAQAALRAEELYRSTRAHGEIMNRWGALHVWAQASGGRIPQEILESEQRERADNQVALAELLRAVALCLLAEGRPGEAAKRFREAWTCGVRGGAVSHAAPIPAWIATALRMRAEQMPPAAQRERGRVLREARAWAQKAVALAARFPRSAPHAQREHAIVLAAAGRSRQALAAFQRSCDLAGGQGAGTELALTLFEKGRAGVALGWTGAAEEREEGLRRLRLAGLDTAPLEAGRLPVLAVKDPEPAVRLGLVDRFAGLLEAGRRICGTLDIQAVEHEVKQCARRLLRAERCEVVWEGHVPQMVSNALLEACRRTGETQAVHEEQVELSESFLLGPARSALCAPIRVNGGMSGFLYADHRGLARRFNEEDRRISEFLASVAGTALENAHRYLEVQQLMASLAQSSEEKDRALRQREALLREVHHRVKSNLQLISSLLALSAGNAPDVDNAIRDVQERVVSMALIHQAVYPSDDFAQVSMEGYLPTLCRHVMAAHASSSARIAVDVRVESLALTVDLAVPCGLVVHELLSNAIRHAFPDGSGNIQVCMRRSGDEAVVEVADDGVGISDAAPGLGLKLVRALCSQMRASVIKDVGAGTRWLIQVPLRPGSSDPHRG